jgi:hypothetical protein
MCWATFSWTCVPTCLATAPAKATDRWARILYPTASSGSVPPNNSQTPTAGNQNAQRAQVALDLLQAERRCFACGEKGHFANRCPNSRPHVNPTVAATPVPTRGANYVPVAAKQNYARGRVNHVVVEEAQEATDVVIGMFLVNNTSTVVMFDSRASHSFMLLHMLGSIICS